MRFPDSQIKAAILHPELNIRELAVKYFADSFTTDTSLMPLVIQAVEKYGRQDGDYLFSSRTALPQTEQTIAWHIDELNEEECGTHPNYVCNLSMSLVVADPALLVPRESDILGARHFHPRAGVILADRIQMRSWDADECWRELEDYCDKAKDETLTNEADDAKADRVVEALGRFGQGCEARVLSILSQDVENSWDNPISWMQQLAVRLAGEARLNSAIPFILKKLAMDSGDVLNEECARALACIGTAEVVKAVAAAYPGSPEHFKNYATESLKRIHSDLAVSTCVELLRHEEVNYLRCTLAYALLAQFASEGIELSRKLLLDKSISPYDNDGLRQRLVETCTLMGERFPEYETWLSEEQASAAEQREWMRMLKDDPDGLFRNAVTKITGEKLPADVPEAMPPKPPISFTIIPPIIAAKQKVGRNDPCPCGSGKKFKKCCLNNPDG